MNKDEAKSSKRNSSILLPESGLYHAEQKFWILLFESFSQSLQCEGELVSSVSSSLHDLECHQ